MGSKSSRELATESDRDKYDSGKRLTKQLELPKTDTSMIETSILDEASPSGYSKGRAESGQLQVTGQETTMDNRKGASVTGHLSNQF